ncbi:MAG: hypothetical protein AAFU78_15415 [Cyanobacteria bacterium J06633_2]
MTAEYLYAFALIATIAITSGFKGLVSAKVQGYGVNAELIVDGRDTEPQGDA